jgi:cell division topological specificity factor
MRILDFFFARTPPTAAVAKERLQIVLAHERASRNGPDFLPALQKDLIAVVGKYVEVRDDMIRVTLGKERDASVLEINIEFEGTRVKSRGPAANAPGGGSARKVALKN